MDVLDQVKAIARAEAERAVRRAQAQQPRYATVTATAPLAVRFWGDAAATGEVDVDASYAPTAGDTVWLVKAGARWLVAGKVA
jgi:hypothetical protein